MKNYVMGRVDLRIRLKLPQEVIQDDLAAVGEHPLMTSDVIWPFLTYLPTLSYPITPDFGGYLGPPTYPNMGRH